jgi:hypothetical protein
LQWVQVDEKFEVGNRIFASFAVKPNGDSSDITFAVYSGTPVTLTLDGEYRLGAKVGVNIYPVYAVDRIDAAACNAATSAYNTALSIRDDRQNDLNAAQAALDAAESALASDSSLYQSDICGKQLSSCRLRFSGQLPFGGFPGANLSR